jgi:hypothetical protein
MVISGVNLKSEGAENPRGGAIVPRVGLKITYIRILLNITDTLYSQRIRVA